MRDTWAPVGPYEMGGGSRSYHGGAKQAENGSQDYKEVKIT